MYRNRYTYKWGVCILCCGSLSFAWCRSGPPSPATMAVADGDGGLPVKTFVFNFYVLSVTKFGSRLASTESETAVNFVMDRSDTYSLFHMRFGVFWIGVDAIWFIFVVFRLNLAGSNFVNCALCNSYAV